MKRMGERNAGNPHVAFDVEGAGNVARPTYVGLAGAPVLDPTDERGRETDRSRGTAPALNSTRPQWLEAGLFAAP